MYNTHHFVDYVVLCTFTQNNVVRFFHFHRVSIFSSTTSWNHVHARWWIIASVVCIVILAIPWSTLFWVDLLCRVGKFWCLFFVVWQCRQNDYCYLIFSHYCVNIGTINEYLKINKKQINKIFNQIINFIKLCI